MAEPNKEAPKIEYAYQVDQTVSITGFMDIDLDGETVRLQITARHNATTEAIKKDIANYVSAWKETRQYYPLPKMPEAPAATVQARDENGIEMVEIGPDGEKKPVMVPLPEGKKLYTVDGMAHSKDKSGVDRLKVFTKEKETFISVKYGVTCFHAPEQYKDFLSWPLDSKYAPKEGAMHVVISAPKDGGKYPDVIEFRP